MPADESYAPDLQIILDEVISTIDYTINNPLRSIWYFYRGTCPNKCNQQIFNLCIDLNMNELRDDLESLKIRYLENDPKTKPQQRLENFLTQVWEKARSYLGSQPIDTQLRLTPLKEEAYRQIKIDVNHVARQFQLDVLIIKEEVVQQSEQEVSSRTDRVSHPTLRQDTYRLVNRMDESQEIQDKFFDSKSSWNITKQKIHTDKILMRKVAFWAAAIVCVGEGLVAAVLTGLPMYVAFFAIGLPAMALNFYLFNDDIYSTQKDIFLGRLVKAKDGRPLSIKQKIGNLFAFITALTAGIGLGCLSFGSSIQSFGVLLFGLTAESALLAPPLFLAGVAGVIGFCSCIALTSLMYTSMATFVRDGAFEQLREYFDDLIKELRNQNKPLHHRLFKGSCEALRAAIVVGLTLVGVITSTAFFIDKTGLILSASIFHLNNSLALNLSTFLSLSGSFSNAFFYLNGIKMALDIIPKALTLTANLVAGVVLSLCIPHIAWRIISKFCQNVRNNPIRSGIIAVECFKFTFLIGCLIPNTHGQGSVANNAAAMQAAQWLMPISEPIRQGISYVSHACASLGYTFSSSVSGSIERFPHGSLTKIPKYIWDMFKQERRGWYEGNQAIDPATPPLNEDLLGDRVRDEPQHRNCFNFLFYFKAKTNAQNTKLSPSMEGAPNSLNRANRFSK